MRGSVFWLGKKTDVFGLGILRTLEGSTVPDCHGCSAAFPRKQVEGRGGSTTRGDGAVSTVEGVSPHGRYRCPECERDFCSDCDEFVHEALHVCPGCR